MRYPAVAALLLSALAGLGASGPDPFATAAKVRVFLFVRTDCPLSNRYAPELQRIYDEFSRRGVEFWLVYPGRSETEKGIAEQVSAYHLPGQVLRDPERRIVKRAEATTAPEAAVFNAEGKLMYHGRIDDRWVDFGKARPAARTHDLEDAIGFVFAGKSVPRPVTRAVGCSLADVE